MANFEAINTIKQEKKRQKDKWYPFHACTPPPPNRMSLSSSGPELEMDSKMSAGPRGQRYQHCAQDRCRISEQLPCRSAEVKIFSVFLCQRCRVKLGVRFFALCFPGFGCARENFTKNFTSKTVWKTENFTQISLWWGASFFLESTIF